MSRKYAIPWIKIPKRDDVKLVSFEIASGTFVLLLSL